MPRIRDNIRDCAVYLYRSAEAAEAGVDAGGSGFLVGIRSKTNENSYHSYVVTNRRVIDDGATVIRLITKAGSTEIIEVPHDDWVVHPDGHDLAVVSVSLEPSSQDYVFVNDYPMFLTRETMEEDRIGLGDDAFVIGRLIDSEGRQHNSPVARFGQIAMMPREEIRRPDGHSQSCFLVDAEPVGGLTGSPVFVSIRNLRLQNPVEFNHAWFPNLLGVYCGQLTNTPPHGSADRNGDASTSAPSAESGLMMVIPAWHLAEVLNLPHFLQARRVQDSRTPAFGMPRYRSLQKA